MIDITKLKSSIKAKRAIIVSRIKRLRKEDPFAVQDRSLIVEPGTDAADLFGHEQVAVLEERLKEELKEIEKALVKIKKNTYGVCEKCSKNIALDRLSAKPSAIFCLNCEKEFESKRA